MRAEQCAENKLGPLQTKDSTVHFRVRRANDDLFIQNTTGRLAQVRSAHVRGSKHNKEPSSCQRGGDGQGGKNRERITWPHRSRGHCAPPPIPLQYPYLGFLLTGGPFAFITASLACV